MRCIVSTFAILISGQIQRFVWKDQNGDLINASNPECPPVVDVFIAMHNGTMSPPWNGQIESLPYDTTTASLMAHYRRRGARHVSVNWVSDHDVGKMKQAVLDSMDAPSLLLINKHRKTRWDRYTVMFFLRHEAFMMAHGHSKYDGYTYWREDNSFFAPLDESVFPSTSQRTVVVDKWCGFGSYSDKIYVANLAGATLLFDSTFRDFQKKMQSWAAFARRCAAKNGSNEDAFQTEAFLGHVLSSVVVHKVDLKRGDTRYVGGRYCLFKGYSECSPTRLGSQLPVC